MAFGPLSRRSFLRHAPAAAAAGAVLATSPASALEPENTDFVSPERAAFKLAELMNAERPGLWRIVINRKNGFVMIYRDTDEQFRDASGAMLALQHT